MKYLIIGLILAFLSGGAILGTQAYQVAKQINSSLTQAIDKE